MKKINFLGVATELKTNTVLLACYAESMISTSETIKEEGKEEETQVFPYKENGEKIKTLCESLFKKGQQQVSAMFKADGVKHVELVFGDQMDFLRGKIQVSKDYQANLASIASVLSELKKNINEMTPSVIHFDSGNRWSPSTTDEKRMHAMMKIVVDVEKMLS